MAAPGSCPPKLLTLLLAAGFVITLIISWLVQITPAGVVLDTRVGRSPGGGLMHLAELVIILVMLVGVSILVYRQIWKVPDPELADTGTPTELLEPTADAIQVEAADALSLNAPLRGLR
jgi:hypothetical protein